MRFLKQNWITLLGIAIGVAGGCAYWLFVGAENSMSEITASPVNCSLWGALIGGLFFNIYQEDRKSIKRKRIRHGKSNLAGIRRDSSLRMQQSSKEQ